MSDRQNPAAGAARKDSKMDILILLGIFALWIILQVWVLPKAGVPT